MSSLWPPTGFSDKAEVEPDLSQQASRRLRWVDEQENSQVLAPPLDFVVVFRVLTKEFALPLGICCPRCGRLSLPIGSADQDVGFKAMVNNRANKPSPLGTSISPAN